MPRLVLGTWLIMVNTLLCSWGKTPSLIIRIVFVFVIFFLELSLIIRFVFVFVIFFLELSLIIRIVFVFVIFFLELSLIIGFVFVFVIFFLELSIYNDVSWFRPLIFVFIQRLNHYFVDRVLITNNHTLNILPHHKKSIMNLKTHTVFLRL